MRRKALVMAVGFVLVALVASAQGKTDFSGTWKLNVDKSDFGPVAGPAAQTDVIEQTGQAMRINVTAATGQGSLQYVMEFTADGREVTIPPDAPLAHPDADVVLQSIAAAWDGSSLVVHEKLTYQEAPVAGVSHYTLSPDGKVLTISSDYASEMGDASRTFIFEKQDSSSGTTAATAAHASPSPAVPSAPAAVSVTVAGDPPATPNLSGTWVLDAAKSDFGPVPPPDSRTDTIEDKEPSIKIAVNQTGGPMGSSSFTLDLVADGKNVTTSTVMGNEAKSTAHWDGNSLVVNTQVGAQGNTATLASTYTLSADGATLTVVRTFSGPMGDAQQKLVFKKK